MAVNPLFRVNRLADERMALAGKARRALPGGLVDNLEEQQEALVT